MEAHLVKKHPLKFTVFAPPEPIVIAGNALRDKYYSKITVMKVEPVLPSEDAAGYCQNLKKLLEIGQARSDRWMYAVFTLKTTTPSVPGRIEITDAYPGTGILGRLQKLFGENVRISVNGRLKDGVKSANVFSFSSEGLEILNFEKDYYCCTINEVGFPNSFWETWPPAGRKHFVGVISIKVVLSDYAMCSMLRETVSSSERNRRDMSILKDGIGNDFTIVAADQVEVKCHKCFLAACSPFFKAKILNSLEDANASSILKLPEMSTASVHALLAYAYAWDVSEALKSCDVAVELYVAGHQYDISGLEETMEKLLFAKPMKWFNVDSAVKILLFVKSFYQENDRKRNLAKKASRVLKWHNKFAPQQVWDSLVFQEAHQNSKTGMELTAMLASVVMDD